MIERITDQGQFLGAFFDFRSQRPLTIRDRTGIAKSFHRQIGCFGCDGKRRLILIVVSRREERRS